MTATAPPPRITSPANPLLTRLRRLRSDPAGYRRHGEIWLDGEHLCSAYVSGGGRLGQALVIDTAWPGQPSLRALAAHAAGVTLVTPALMAAVSALETPPPIGFVVPWQGDPAAMTGVPTVVLDRLQDAGNVGAILRSAAAFGFRQVVALRGTAALWSPKVLRAGMGAHFGLALVERVDGSDPAVLQALGVPLLATSPRAERAVHDVRLPWPCAWLLGHEGQGVAPALLASCSQSLRIPQPGGEESLNVAAAAAVCFYESARQRAPA